MANTPRSPSPGNMPRSSPRICARSPATRTSLSSISFGRGRFPVKAGGAEEARSRLLARQLRFRSAERLDGNIGYLRLDRFAPASDAARPSGRVAMLAATEARSSIFATMAV